MAITTAAAPPSQLPSNPFFNQELLQQEAARKETQIAEANENRFVSSEEINNFYGDSHSEYVEQYNTLAESGDSIGVSQLNASYKAFKDKRNKASAPEGDLIFDDMSANTELVKSLRRRYGHKDIQGNVVSDQQLIDTWADEQHFFDFNTGKLLMDAATLEALPLQKQQDFLLQLETWERVSGTGKGSQDLSSQAWEIAKGLITDPITYVGIGTLGVGLLAKEGGKQASKAGIKALLRKSIQTKIGKGVAIGSIEGGTVATAHEIAKQTVVSKVQGLDAIENMNWEKVVKQAGLGVVLGAGLGGIFGAGASVIGKWIDNHVAKTGTSYSEVVKKITELESDADAKLFMTRDLGLTESQADNLISGFHEKGVRFDKERNKWQTQDGTVYNTADQLTAKEMDKLSTPAIIRQQKSVEKAEVLVAKLTEKATTLTQKSAIAKNKIELAKAKRSLKTKQKILQKKQENQRIANEVILAENPPTERMSNEQKAEILTAVGSTEQQLNKIIEDDLVLANLDSVTQSSVRQNTTEGKSLLGIGDWLANSPLARFTVGGDTLAIKAGAAHIVNRLRGVHANHSRNLAKLKGKLQDAIQKTGSDQSRLLSLIRQGNTVNKGIKVTSEERKFLSLWTAVRKQQLDLAVKNKIITRKQAHAFLTNTSYVPRVYNFKLLQSKVGAEQFAVLLNKTLKSDPKAAEAIIRTITGRFDDKYTPQSGSFTAKDVQKLLVVNKNPSKDSTANMSTHLEFSRKIKGIPEEELDKFMLDAEGRMSSFLDDIIMRNELASKFGAKNEVVNATLAKLKNQGKVKAADDIGEYFFTSVGDASRSKALTAMRTSEWAGVIAKLNSFQNLKLVLSAIPNATQAFVFGAARLASATNPINAIYLSGMNVLRSFTKESKQFAQRAGVLNEMDMQRMLLENNTGGRIFNWEGKGFLKPLNYLNDNTKFLRAVGFHGVEVLNRRAGATMGAMKAQLLHKKLSTKLSPTKRQKVLKDLEDLGITDVNKKTLSDEDLHNAGYFFNKEINFSGEHINLPASWHGPWGKLFSKFRSFQLYSGRFMKRHVIDELIIHKNPAPAVAFIIAGSPAGAGVKALRLELSNMFADDKFVEENQTAIEQLFTGLGYVGAWGVWVDMLNQAGGSAFDKLGLVGPSGSTIFKTFDAGAKIAEGEFTKTAEIIFKEIVPGIPGKKAIMEELFPKKSNKRTSGSLF